MTGQPLRAALLISAIFAAPQAALAGITAFAVDYDQFHHNRSIADGVLSANEYQWGSQFFQGFGSGAGGVLGGAGARLYFSSSDRGIVLGFQPGAAQHGTIILMVDAGHGGGRRAGSGAGIAALNDSADSARRALSSLRGRYPVTGVFDDRYEFAVTFNADGARAWSVPGDLESTFTPLGDYAGATGTGAVFREALIPIGNGSWGSVGGFTLFAAYVGENGYLYDESLPAQPYTGGTNPGAGSSPDFTNAALVAEFIPSPPAGAALLLALSAYRRRR